ncbi:hypothetical protein L1987_15684 [Smallanthus sonchifolius]|uniref:Uncharacterized protein n=1 Tax=Smallanthus sonchifolius TaxID=185202 RepID=A0ACB9J6S5_9ASTR|nr:hypothetical protein L1987_15684 [Smallanthus sonchifolius]
MLETLVPGSLLRKVTESIKDLVDEANFDCSSTGISLQAMDPRHEALASLLLRSEGFDHYCCDRNLSLGLNLHDLAKMLRYAGYDDIVTITADDDGDRATFLFENFSNISFFSYVLALVTGYFFCTINEDLGARSLVYQDKIAEFDMKLMDLDYEHLQVTEKEYDAIVQMPSSELARICKELSTIGDTGVISVTKEGVKFSIKGDNGTQILCADKMIVFTRMRYMNLFTKATPLANQVTVRLAPEMPIVVEYKIAEMGYLRFYLAPKIEDELSDNELVFYSSELPIVMEYKIEEMGYLRFYLAPKIKEDEEMGGHDTVPVETKKQPEKKLKTEPKSNGETKRRVMKIDLDEDEEEIKPKIENRP